MKNLLSTATTFLLILALLAGCGAPQPEQTGNTESTAAAAAPTAAPSSEATTETTSAETEEDTEYEGDASSYYIDVVYAQQIERYYTAISQQWDEDAYRDHEMSPLVTHYYGEKSLDNVGFTFMESRFLTLT